MPAKLSLKDAQTSAALRGGACLSPEYVNNRSRMVWKCAEGHVWEASLHNIRAGHWCHQCAHRVPPTISEARELATLKKGACLSSEIRTTRTRLQWRCERGHTWSAGLGAVKQGQWCPTCAGKRLTLEDMQARAAKRGGTCLAPLYKPSSKLPWQCSEGHVWEEFPAVINHSWCPFCAGRRQTIEDMQAIAKSKGGRCLSKVYKTCMENLQWQCSKGHTWDATPLNVRRTSWCPRCKQNKRERYCREIFEEIYRVPFPKCRPVWLRNSRGNQMELDGFSETLRLAFEYQGFQHYEQSYLHTPEEFKWQQQRDREKRELCAANGVTLVEVPWHTKNLRAFVSKHKEAA